MKLLNNFSESRKPNDWIIKQKNIVYMNCKESTQHSK